MPEQAGRTVNKLYRVFLKTSEYVGATEQWHAKVVASDLLGALEGTLERLSLDPEILENANVTLIGESTELPAGKVFDIARRSRAFGERGAWVDLPEKSPEPRETPLL